MDLQLRPFREGIPDGLHEVQDINVVGIGPLGRLFGPLPSIWTDVGDIDGPDTVLWYLIRVEFAPPDDPRAACDNGWIITNMDGWYPVIRGEQYRIPRLYAVEDSALVASHSQTKHYPKALSDRDKTLLQKWIHTYIASFGV